MLSVLFAAFAAELAELNAYAVPLMGEAWLARTDPPPRIIFVPVDDAFGPVEGPGGNPRPIANVLKSVDLVIHGETFDHCEGMRDQCVIALHAVAKKATAGSAGRAGRIVLGKGKWSRGTKHAKNGEEYVLSFSYGAPIVKRSWITPLPGDPPQAPVAATYTGDQANTYPVVPAAELKAGVDVGMHDGHPDNIEIDLDP